MTGATWVAGVSFSAEVFDRGKLSTIESVDAVTAEPLVG